MTGVVDGLSRSGPHTRTLPQTSNIYVISVDLTESSGDF